MQPTTAAAEDALRAAYKDATTIIKAQPEGEKGCVIVLSMIENDAVGLAYGASKEWAKLLFGVAQQSRDFKDALLLALLAIQDEDEQPDFDL